MWASWWTWTPAMMVFWPKPEVWMRFASILLDYAFWFAQFGQFLHLFLQNMYIPKLMENVSWKP